MTQPRLPRWSASQCAFGATAGWSRDACAAALERKKKKKNERKEKMKEEKTEKKAKSWLDVPCLRYFC
jgi:hypothetical protein